MEKFNKLICYLLALANFAKDIHYSCHGDAFYGKHLFADRIQENMYEFIDQIKEICILGNNEEPLPSGEYLSRATSLIPQKSNDDLENFKSMQALMLNTLTHIENMESLTVGEENLVGNIAQDIQNNLGLVNLQVKG